MVSMECLVLCMVAYGNMARMDWEPDRLGFALASVGMVFVEQTDKCGKLKEHGIED